MSNESPRTRLEVAGSVSARVAPDELTRPDPDVGQIWIARPDEGPDVLVLVTDVSDDHVQALLCTDDDGLATETDAVLGPLMTGLGRRLLVHGDVAGSILRTRLSGSTGRIDPEIARRIVLRGRGLDFNSGDLGRGSPMINESDPRWDAKMERVKELKAVKACASELGLKISALGGRSAPPV
jgi:hypothetical protein